MNIYKINFSLKKVLFAVSMLLGLALYAFSTVYAQQGGSGAIWTTTGSCGEPQNINQYEVGETVYINGSNFATSTEYDWIIKEPGANGAEIASGQLTTDTNGDFCISAHTLEEGDIGGPYSADVDGKKDNFSVVSGDPDPVLGCIDDTANNYDPEATEDDGSCEYDEDPILGCTDEAANNYDPEATQDDDSCTYDEDPDPVLGCIDDTANNYDPEATEDDGSCEYDEDPIPGCTDEAANNYDPEATQDDDSCTYDEKVATINFHKIVCTDESELPNWGPESPEYTPPIVDVDSSTAQDWVAKYDSCSFEKDWYFEWTTGDDVTKNSTNYYYYYPGDAFIGPIGNPWTTEGPTDANGHIAVSLTADEIDGNDEIWFREVQQVGFIPFTWDTEGGANTDNYSAEFYCESDVRRYDNMEVIGMHDGSIALGEEYYCVAWNVPEPGDTGGGGDDDDDDTPPVGDDDDDDDIPEDPDSPYAECLIPDSNLLENGSFEDDEVTNASGWQKFASVVGWTVEKVSDAVATTLELHREWSGNEAAEGLQYAELDGDHSTRISQTEVLEDGALYKLWWAFAPRQNTNAEENQLSVEIDGTEVATEGPMNGIGVLEESDWVRGSTTLLGDGTETEFAFSDLGPSNDPGGPDVGTFVDDIYLCKIAEPQPQGGGAMNEGTSGGGGSILNRGDDDDDDDDDDTPSGQTRGDSDSRDDDDDDSSTGGNDKPKGDVEGEQVSITPLGAANTGFGGASSNTTTFPLIALLGMILSVAILRISPVNE